MGFIEKTFDMKTFIRAIHKQPGADECSKAPGAPAPGDLSPCIYDVYIQILRYGTIDIAKLDLGGICDGDIDSLENALDSSPADGLALLCEIFRQFEPSAAARRGFI